MKQKRPRARGARQRLHETTRIAVRAAADKTPRSGGRTAFSFSRDLEFATEPELVKRMGCAADLWLRAAVKELIDNALDAAEEAGVEPVITVEVDEHTLTVTDNGPGMAPELVERLCVRSERTSTREAYAAPDRGAKAMRSRS